MARIDRRMGLCVPCALLCLGLGCTQPDPGVQVGKTDEALAGAFNPVRRRAAEAWERAPGEHAALELARAYFPEIAGEASPAEGELPVNPATALRVKLPVVADGEMEIATRGLVFKVRQPRGGAAPVSVRTRDATFYGPRHLWLAAEGMTRRAEEYAVVEGGGPAYRAEYQVTVPEEITSLRDAGEYLELLESGSVPVLRLHYAVARDGEGRSRWGTVRLWGAAPSGEQDGLPVLALQGRTLRVRMDVPLDGLVGTVVVDPGWSSTGSMAVYRTCHTSTLLPSGKVMAAGGYVEDSYSRGSASLSTVELFDPGTGAWSASGSQMMSGRHCHAATVLLSGKVLVVGGFWHGVGSLATAELYDPMTGDWSSTGSMLDARYDASATRLLSGKVLVSGASMTAAEVYDPASETWSRTGSMTTARDRPTTTLLQSGKVLVAGGGGHLTAELYDPEAGTWALTGSMASGRSGHAAVRLPSGKVLVAGGFDNQGYPWNAELYDPVSGTWSNTGALPGGRSPVSAILLPSGKVLLAGGRGLYASYPIPAVYDPATGDWSPTGPLAVPEYWDRRIATVLPSGKVFMERQMYDPGAGAWSPGGSMSSARSGHTATLLPSGKVLVAGGYVDSHTAVPGAELHDAAASTWSATGPLAIARHGHTATLLQDGTVLVAGGSSGSTSLAAAEIYDPSTGTWSATAPLASPRAHHTATLLPSGKVLVAGGVGSVILASGELYDPVSREWSPAGSLAAGRHGHTATVLPSGKVLLAGGVGAAGSLASAELYDPAAGTWAVTGSLVTARFGHTATALERGGKVLVAGGVGASGPLASAELYNPASGTWNAIASLAAARVNHTAAMLPSGGVLVTGGPGSTAELYDPVRAAWTAAASMGTTRMHHTATMLPSGKLLVAGGDDLTGSVASSETYEGTGAQDSWRPTLNPAGSMGAGATVILSGSGLAGRWEGNDGNPSGSATNFPVLTLRRMNGELLAPLPVQQFSGTTVRTTLPAVASGYYVLSVVTGGIQGGQIFQILDATRPVAPLILSPINGAVLSVPLPPFIGWAEAGSRVTLLLDGAPAGSATADEAGSWTRSFAVPLAIGAHSVTAQATDAAGNVSPPTTFAFTVVPTPLAVLAPASGARLPVASPTVSGTAEAGSTVIVSFDGVHAGGAMADEMGVWSFTATSALAQGAHTVTASADGSTGPASVTVSFIVDTVAPAMPVVEAPASLASVAVETPRISGTAEAGSTVTISFDEAMAGTTVASATGNWTFTPGSPLDEGPHTVVVHAADAVGNVSPGAAVWFTVDTVAPPAPVVQVPAARAVVQTRLPEISGTAERGSTVTVSVDGTVVMTAAVGDAGSWSFQQASPLARGTHAIVAQARDAAGNISPFSTEVRFDVSPILTPPVILSPDAWSVVSTSTPIISGKSEESAMVVVYLDSVHAGFTWTDGSGLWRLSGVGPLAAGTHVVKARVYAGGQASTPSEDVVFTVDVTGVATPEIQSPPRSATVRTQAPVISGSASPHLLVGILIDGKHVETVMSNAQGVWSYTPATPLASGAHQIQAYARESSERTSALSGAHGFTVDLSPPLPPVILTPVAGLPVAQAGLVISGTAEVGTVVDVSLDGRQVGRAVVSPEGRWRLAEPPVLELGPHEVKAYAVGQSSNRSSLSAVIHFDVSGKSHYTFGCSALPSGNLPPWALLLLGLGWRRASRRVRERNP